MAMTARHTKTHGISSFKHNLDNLSRRNTLSISAFLALSQNAFVTVEIMMQPVSRRSLAKVSLGVAAAALVLAETATEAAAFQPNMDEALRALEAAMASLSRATPNKGGHRERAMALVSEAIREVRAGVAYGGY